MASSCWVGGSSAVLSSLLLFLLLCVVVSNGQRLPGWDNCHCSWTQWQQWSSCSSPCWGRRQRIRHVNVDNTPQCSNTYDVCDEYEGFFDREECNPNCTFGQMVEFSETNKSCACPLGRSGPCCEIAANCGPPPPIENGQWEGGGDFSLGSKVSYRCQDDFRLLGAAAERSCESDGVPGSRIGVWSGASPRCAYFASCASSPCNNGSSCENLPDSFRCLCAPGWTGSLCEQDVQPPEPDLCPENRTVVTSQRRAPVTWVPPTFHDPLGRPVHVTSQYAGGQHEFPWGHFPVLYSAVKPSNGLRTECTFYVSVIPHPCPALTPPAHGLLACNGWRREFGSYCLPGCLQGFTLPPVSDPEEFWVCGARGIWSSPRHPPDCIAELPVTQRPPPPLPPPRNCSDITGLQEVRAGYIRALQSSEFNSACVEYPDVCSPDNVSLYCSDP